MEIYDHHFFKDHSLGLLVIMMVLKWSSLEVSYSILAEHSENSEFVIAIITIMMIVKTMRSYICMRLALAGSVATASVKSAEATNKRSAHKSTLYRPAIWYLQEEILGICI